MAGILIGYLLDNNHVSAFVNRVPAVLEKLKTLPANSQIRICTITLGEIEAGNEMNHSTDDSRREESLRLINETFLPNAIKVSSETRFYYGKIMGRIWAKYPPPPNSKVSTEQHLVNLGVDINDVWAVACAWEHCFIFVTHDKMKCIKEVVEPKDVQFECWY